MRFLIRTLSLRHAWLHPLRTVLTMIGIATGTAMGVGVGLLNESTLASFNEMVQGVAGKSDLTITVPGRGGMPEEALEKVVALPGVKAAAPTLRVTGYLSDHPSETILILGVDTLADADFKTLKVADEPDFDPLSFLNTPDSVLVPRSLADRTGIKQGDRLRVTARGREFVFTVRAIVSEKGAAKVFSGNVVIMDVYSAQTQLGREGVFDQIDVISQPGTDRFALIQHLKQSLGEGYIVEQPGRNRQAEKMVEGLRKTTDMLGVLALFVGMFLIYNTFSTAVAQRRREVGILRALGTTRAQVVVIFLGEALIMGVIGAVVGVWGGVFLARLLLDQFSASISNFYFQTHPEVVRLSLPLVVRYIVLGAVTAVVSAAFPAHKAATIAPVEAMSTLQLDMERRRHYRWAFMAGLLCLGVEISILQQNWEQTRIEIGVISALVSFIALALLSPMLIAAACALLRPLNTHVLGVEARLGADNLTRAVGRTAVTVAALMIGITLAVAMGGSFASLSWSLDEWITSGITADLTVRGSVNIPGANSVDIPLDLAKDLAQVSGVADVGSFRITPVPMGDQVIHVYAIPFATFWKYSAFRWTEGDRSRDGPKLLTGKYTVISENLAAKYNLHKGDKLTIQTPSGLRTYEIVGVHVDYTSDLGSAALDRDAFLVAFGDRFVDSISVWVEPGVDPVRVREEIRRRFSDRRLFIQTNKEYREEIHKAVDQIFALTDVVQLLVIVIAVIGILNTLLISILDRTRELGVLRALGFTRGQLAKLIVWEAGLMGLLAGVLGAVSGSAFSMSIVHLINHQLVGWSTAYVFPTESVVKGFVVAVLSSLVAAGYPAHKAAGLNIVQAMEYE